MLIFQEKGDEDDESDGKDDERDDECDDWSESDDVIPPSITAKRKVII